MKNLVVYFTVILMSIITFSLRAENPVSIGQSYPNPANYFTRIPIYNLKSTATLQVFDMLGKVVQSQQVVPQNTSTGVTMVEVRTEDLPRGQFIYVVIDSYKGGNGQHIAGKMTVIH